MISPVGWVVLRHVRGTRKPRRVYCGGEHDARKVYDRVVERGDDSDSTVALELRDTRGVVRASTREGDTG